MPVHDDVARRPNAWPCRNRAEQPQQRQHWWHNQREHHTPIRIGIRHRRRIGNHQKRLRRQIGVGAVRQVGRFVMNLAPIEIQPFLGRAEQFDLLLIDDVLGRLVCDNSDTVN